jgi:hypothetical protein
MVLMAGPPTDMDGCSCRSGLAPGGQGTIQERRMGDKRASDVGAACMFLFMRIVAADWARLPGTIQEVLPGVLWYTHHDGFGSSKRLEGGAERPITHVIPAL